MKISLNRHIFGISVIRIGKCDCDQDYCLTCELKFRMSHIIRKFVPKGK